MGRASPCSSSSRAPRSSPTLVDRVYVLEQGRTVGQGTLDEIGGVAAVADLYLGLDRRARISPDSRPVTATA